MHVSTVLGMAVREKRGGVPAPRKDSGSTGLLEETSINGGRNGAEGNEVGGELPHGDIGSDKYRQPLSMFHEEDYCMKLPRNRRKSRLYLGFSCNSWLFLLLALLQAVLVVGFQVAIAVYGKFRNGRLDEYVRCFEDSIGYENGTLPSNITFPTFGRDKEIYVYFFISLVIYSFCLCVYALKVQNIVEVYMFLIINVLAISYAGVQVYQFRGFGDECDAITFVGYLALANTFMLAIFTVIFAVLSFFIYVEFGWKIYTRVGCNSQLRYYYRVYEVFMSGVKLLILFMLIFFVGQCILLLFVDKHNINYEFWVVVFAGVPVAIAIYPITYWIVRHENIIGSIVLFVTDVLVIAYTAYKIYRYITRSCPLCKQQVEDLRTEVEDIENTLDRNGSTSVREIVDRIEQFEHLVLLGALNLVIAVLILIVFIHLLRQYRKGLKEYFAKESKESSSICSCCSTKESFDLGPETHKRRFLNLRNQWNQNLRRKTHNKSMSSKRESELIETLNRSDPNFGSAEPTNRHFKTLKQIPSDPEKRQTNMSSSQATGNSQKIPVKARKTSSSLDAGDSPEMSAKGIKTSSSLDAGDSPQMPSRERHTVN